MEQTFRSAAGRQWKVIEIGQYAEGGPRIVQKPFSLNDCTVVLSNVGRS